MHEKPTETHLRDPSVTPAQLHKYMISSISSVTYFYYSYSSPAATAIGRVASPVIPVAPNIATFLMESDIVLNKRDPRDSNTWSAEECPE